MANLDERAQRELMKEGLAGEGRSHAAQPGRPRSRMRPQQPAQQAAAPRRSSIPSFEQPVPPASRPQSRAGRKKGRRCLLSPDQGPPIATEITLWE